MYCSVLALRSYLANQRSMSSECCGVPGPDHLSLDQCLMCPCFTRRPDTTEEPQKPNLFDPFSGAQENNLQISPSFASNPSFSQEKINAFANLLAVVNDVEESSSPVPSIGSVSLGEGGMVAHDMDDDDVEAVTSRRVNQFEFFTPKSVQGLR